MKSRPLKVGEYRKVKTWEQLLATEGAKVDSGGDLAIGFRVFLPKMKTYCGEVFKIKTYCGGWFKIDNGRYTFIADFFTNDYYDEKGNEIKMEHTWVDEKGNEIKMEHTWVDDINPLDQLEHEAKQTLTKIAKLREIEAKQVEIDTKIEEQNKRIEEYEKGEL